MTEQEQGDAVKAAVALANNPNATAEIKTLAKAVEALAAMITLDRQHLTTLRMNQRG